MWIQYFIVPNIQLARQKSSPKTFKKWYNTISSKTSSNTSFYILDLLQLPYTKVPFQTDIEFEGFDLGITQFLAVLALILFLGIFTLIFIYVTNVFFFGVNVTTVLIMHKWKNWICLVFKSFPNNIILIKN